MSRQRAWTDEEVLEVLHLRDHHGLSAARIARRLGVSRFVITGLWRAINRAEQRFDAAGVGNGTLAPKWWVRR